MTNMRMTELLAARGLVPLARDPSLIVSERVLICESGDGFAVCLNDDAMRARGRNPGVDSQANLVVDAVHLCLHSNPPRKSARIIFRRLADKAQTELENAVAVLIKSLKEPPTIEPQVEDEQPRKFEAQPYGKPNWYARLMEEKSDLPDIAKDLEAAVNDDSFRWYRSVTADYWSGRIGGLEVCRVSSDGKERRLQLGGINEGPAKKVFMKILEEEKVKAGAFEHHQIKDVAKAIRSLAESRKNGKLKKYQREHLLESRILSGNLKIATAAGTPVPVLGDHPFQYPALWVPGGSAKFVDALMRIGDVPYVVELKAESNRGQGYRHAITQAVLYREFIREAVALHPWFERRGLDPRKCRALVAFPELEGRNRGLLLNLHSAVGRAFDVGVAEIKGF